ncbi:MAG: hypothetical protein GXO47_13395 [Chlorobi bacterium]|nr:hypothetical protein [Chlorobiota bacterium]
MKFSFIKTPRHRVFSHEPIYYDELKERQKEREKKIKEELGMLSEEEQKMGYASRIRGSFKGAQIKPHYEVTRSIRRKSNLRLVIILILLILLAQYLVKSGEEWYLQFFAK